MGVLDLGMGNRKGLAVRTGLSLESAGFNFGEAGLLGDFSSELCAEVIFVVVTAGVRNGFNLMYPSSICAARPSSHGFSTDPSWKNHPPLRTWISR